MQTIVITAADCLGCCCPLEGDLEAEILVYTGCGCVQGPDGNWYSITSHTGITGTHTIPIITPGTSDFLATVGTVTVQKYTASGCATPDGAPTVVDVKLNVVCDEDGLFIFLSAPGFFLPSGGAAFVASSAAFNEVVPNTITCANGVSFTVDTIQITVP